MTVDVRRYRVVVEPLAEELGGGFVSYAPDLKGCMSDGATPDEALHNIYDAIACWLDTAAETGSTVMSPEPARRFA